MPGSQRPPLADAPQNIADAPSGPRKAHASGMLHPIPWPVSKHHSSSLADTPQAGGQGLVQANSSAKIQLQLDDTGNMPVTHMPAAAPVPDNRQAHAFQTAEFGQVQIASDSMRESSPLPNSIAAELLPAGTSAAANLLRTALWQLPDQPASQAALAACKAASGTNVSAPASHPQAESPIADPAKPLGEVAHAQPCSRKRMAPAQPHRPAKPAAKRRRAAASFPDSDDASDAAESSSGCSGAAAEAATDCSASDSEPNVNGVLHDGSSDLVSDDEVSHTDADDGSDDESAPTRGPRQRNRRLAAPVQHHDAADGLLPEAGMVDESALLPTRGRRKQSRRRDAQSTHAEGVAGEVLGAAEMSSLTVVQLKQR